MAGKNVYLWTSPNGTTWTRVPTPDVTDGVGTYSFDVAPTLKTYYKVQYEGDPDCAGGFSSSNACAPMLPVFRFFNTREGVHFYTASDAEKSNVIKNLSSIYRYEGIGYQVNVSNPDNKLPLYRFYNTKRGVHFYTANATEANDVIARLSGTYKYEGVAYHVSENPANGTPVYRFYNFKQGVHFYTASEVEKNNVVKNLTSTYTYEGVGYYIGN
jgi:hypothetical protein